MITDIIREASQTIASAVCGNNADHQWEDSLSGSVAKVAESIKMVSYSADKIAESIKDLTQAIRENAPI